MINFFFFPFIPNYRKQTLYFEMLIVLCLSHCFNEHAYCSPDPSWSGLLFCGSGVETCLHGTENDNVFKAI